MFPVFQSLRLGETFNLHWGFSALKACIGGNNMQYPVVELVARFFEGSLRFPCDQYSIIVRSLYSKRETNCLIGVT